MATPFIPVYRSIGWPYQGQVEANLAVLLEAFHTNEGKSDMRRRPKKICGVVWDVGGRARSDLVSIVDVRADQSLDTRNPTFGIGGHLIAVSLNGVDAGCNIVPVSKQTNDKMSSVEAELRKLCTGPRYLEVEVPEYYDSVDKDPRVPRRFVYTLYHNPQPQGDGNPVVYRKEITQDWLQVGPSTHAAEKIAEVHRAIRYLAETNWAIESVAEAGSAKRSMLFLKGYLPPPGKRPLAFIDLLIIEKPHVLGVDPTLVAQYIQSIKLGGKFEKQYRMWAIMGNILKNNNWLRSNVYGARDAALELLHQGVVTENFDHLVVGGGLNAPHVDHIVPKSLKGPNCFSNAQIVSHSYNVQKGNCTKPLEYRSEEWKQQMLAKYATDNSDVKKWV